MVSSLKLEVSSDFSEELVEFVFSGFHDDIVSAGEIALGAFKRLFEISEASPGVVFTRSLGSDAPEIEIFYTLFSGV